jgi:hypothetical protein
LNLPFFNILLQLDRSKITIPAHSSFICILHCTLKNEKDTIRVYKHIEAHSHRTHFVIHIKPPDYFVRLQPSRKSSFSNTSRVMLSSTIIAVPFFLLVISSATVHGKNDTTTAVNDITAMEYDAWQSKVSNSLTSLNVTYAKQNWVTLLDAVPANQVRKKARMFASCYDYQ